MLMSTVLPAIGFVWWQDCVLPKVESLWWQDKRSGIIIIPILLSQLFPVGFYHCNNSRLLHSAVKKKWQALSPGSEVLTTLNRLSVTRSWNWSTWANGDVSRKCSTQQMTWHSWPISQNRKRIPGWAVRPRPVVDGGCDSIQNGGQIRINPPPTTGGPGGPSTLLITICRIWQCKIFRTVYNYMSSTGFNTWPVFSYINMNDIVERSALFSFLSYAGDTSHVRHTNVNDGDSIYLFR